MRRTNRHTRLRSTIPAYHKSARCAGRSGNIPDRNGLSPAMQEPSSEEADSIPKRNAGETIKWTGNLLTSLGIVTSEKYIVDARLDAGHLGRWHAAGGWGVRGNGDRLLCAAVPWTGIVTGAEVATVWQFPVGRDACGSWAQSSAPWRRSRVYIGVWERSNGTGYLSELCPMQGTLVRIRLPGCDSSLPPSLLPCPSACQGMTRKRGNQEARSGMGLALGSCIPAFLSTIRTRREDAAAVK